LFNYLIVNGSNQSYVNFVSFYVTLQSNKVHIKVFYELKKVENDRTFNKRNFFRKSF
jgi:hypothetical protein